VIFFGEKAQLAGTFLQVILSEKNQEFSQIRGTRYCTLPPKFRALLNNPL
jgi:hypothetical protein